MIKKKRRSILLLVMSLLLCFFTYTYAPLTAVEQGDSLLITKTGLKEDVILYEKDWLDFNNPHFIERFYSSNNRFNFHKIWIVRGFDLFSLIGDENLIDDSDYPITFIASDEAHYTESLYSLKDRYYYPTFIADAGEPIYPMIGFYRTELYDSNDLKPPISWDVRDLTVGDYDMDSPRLYLGQERGNTSNPNNSFFLRDLIKIVVGDERKESHDDFTKSPYKHISYDGPPYNVDALTGATLTIEGPGTYSYRAISLRQIEEEDDGIFQET